MADAVIEANQGEEAYVDEQQEAAEEAAEAAEDIEEIAQTEE